MHIPHDVRRAGRMAVRIYLKAIRNGTAPRMAEMFALRRGPRADTDKAFLSQHSSRHLPEGMRAQLALRAKKQGISEHAVYDGQLADAPYHPTGYVETRAQVRKREQAIDQRYEKEVAAWARPGKRLHPRIVMDTIREYVQQDPSLAQKPKEELAEMVIDNHGL